MEKSFPFNAALVDGQPDRVYSAEDFAAERAAYVSNGVCAGDALLVTPGAGGGMTVQLPCCHSAAETREELYAMVDCGCTVQDVIVEHPVYGQLTAALQLSSRYDVDQYMERMASSDARPLSLLTEGIHLHTLSCPNADALHHLREKLRAMGVLLEEQN